MTDALDRLKTALADRYTIERELGSGGMATVYLAHDVKHDRQVALKVMRPELSAILGGERFLREIRIAAKLNHPHILALYDSGSADGFLYYVMPHVEGESLRAKIEREKQLSIDEAVTLARQVASALDYAHQQGVIHRDIKPENILLHRGEAVVADFGIALAVTAAGGERLTETGLSLGTPEYMSPEQATGSGELDARTDVYSLGAVLYEMVTGEPPQTGATVQAVIAKLLSERPTQPRVVRDSVPEAMDRAIMKALAKVPADRFDSAAQFATTLTAEVVKPEDEKKSIVVLPFENLSPDPENEYFSDGLTEELIAELSGIRALRVISRTTAMKLKGSDKDVGTIGRELDVQYVLEGSVRKVGNALRITAQLIDATKDGHLWVDRYTGTMDDVFEIQESLARKIVDQLRISLSPEEDRLIAQRPINDLVAYDCYLRAKREMPRWTDDAMDRAIALLEKALTIEGPNELLYATLGFAHLGYLMPLPLRDDESVLGIADSYATKVFELNPDSPAGHALRGLVLFAEGRIEEAVSHSKDAHRLDPNNGDALMCLVCTSTWAGHSDAARRYHQRLTVINPWSGSNPAWIEFYSGRFESAIDGYRKEYEVDPNSPYTRWAYACVLAWAGRIDEGCEIFEQIAQDTPDSMHGRFATVYSKALRGDAAGALRTVTPELIAAAKPHWQLRWMMAPLYALIGREAEALDWLELAVNRGFFNYPFLQREPFLRKLHSQPRFQTIMDEAKRRSEAFEP
jgi:serine/threonine protein kinase/tetratricopeptide (TPR) repeat protein